MERFTEATAILPPHCSRILEMITRKKVSFLRLILVFLIKSLQQRAQTIDALLVADVGSIGVSFGVLQPTGFKGAILCDECENGGTSSEEMGTAAVFGGCLLRSCQAGA